MKKFIVENHVDTPEMYRGEAPHSEITNNYVGDYIIAETAEEAISLAKDYIIDHSDGNCKRNDSTDEIIFYDKNGEITEVLYDFSSKLYRKGE